MIKEVTDNSLDSPRLTKLQECLDYWIECFEHDIEESEGIDLFLVGYDNKYKHGIKCALTSKNEPIHDLFRAFNKGLGTLNDDLSKDMFNGLCSYLANVLATYPEIEKQFNENVQRMKRKIEYESR